MFAVATFSGLDRLEPLRELWERLYTSTPDASFTQSFDWFAAAAEEGGREPRAYAATVSGKVIGLWPMFLASRRGTFGRVRVLRSGGDEAPRLGPIGPNPAATATIVLRHLTGATDWDRLLLTETAGADGGPGRYATALAAAGLPPRSGLTWPFAEVELKGLWTAIVSRCDDRTRLALWRMYGREGCHEVVFERFRPAAGAEAPGCLGEALRLAPEGERSALAMTFAAACRHGAADIALLRHEGRLVASALSFVTAAGLENRFAGVETGAPPFAGVRLMEGLLRDSLMRGDRRFTFISTPDHPAIGWGRTCGERATLRVESPVRAAGLGRIGERVRRAFCGEAVAAGA